MHARKFISGILLALPLLLLTAGGAWAVTPANTLIRNTATLTGTGLPAGGITASVDVKVDLVAQKPTLSKATVITQMPDDNSVAEGQSSTAIYRLTTNANGPDSFAITQESPLVATNLTGYGTVSYTGNTFPLQLGATAAGVATAAGAMTITVPYDGTDNDNVNEIVGNDFVRIRDYDYEVDSVEENPVGNTATITLKTSLQQAIGVGELIREYKLFNMVLSSVGNVSNGGDPAYIDVPTKATSQTNNALYDADSLTNTPGNGSNGHRTNVVSISFEKYVRNVTTANGSGTAETFNSESFYPTSGGVTAAPGEILEYALVIKTSVAGLPGARVSDTIPAFTTYQANSTKVNNVPIADVGGALPLLPPGHALGDIVGAQQIVVTFQVKINE